MSYIFEQNPYVPGNRFLRKNKKLLQKDKNFAREITKKLLFHKKS